MQSLYNIAGFLGAQSRSNPSDHGDSWHSHKAVKLQSPSQDDTSSPAFIEQLYQECLEIVAEQPKKPLISLEQLALNHATIEENLTSNVFKVGDTVKLVSDRHLHANWAGDLTLGNNYKVVEVDPKDPYRSIMIIDDAQDDVWVVTEDFQQV